MKHTLTAVLVMGFGVSSLLAASDRPQTPIQLVALPGAETDLEFPTVATDQSRPSDEITTMCEGCDPLEPDPGPWGGDEVGGGYGSCIPYHFCENTDQYGQPLTWQTCKRSGERSCAYEKSNRVSVPR